MLAALRLRARVSLAMIGITSLAVLACGGILLRAATGGIGDEARAHAGAIAEQYGAYVASQFASAMTVAQGLSATFEGLHDRGVADRDAYNAVLERTLAQNKLLVGVWTGWEANALEGRDADFANTGGHDSSGRFIPYWVRSAGKIVMVPLEAYDQSGAGDYYQIPKRTGAAAVIDPFVYQVDGKDVLMTTLAVPVRSKGAVVGVVGVDIALDGLQSVLSAIRPFGSGYLTIVTESGGIVSHPKASWLGKNVRDLGLAADLVKGLTAGERKAVSGASAEVEGGRALVVTQPFTFDGLAKPWTVAVVAPESVVLAAVGTMQWLVVAILAAAVLVAGGVALFVGGNLAKPIVAMTAAMTRLAKGDTTVEVPGHDRKDEIGEMAASVLVFKNDALDKARLEEERAELERRAEQEKKEMMARMAGGFEASVGKIVRRVSSASSELNNSAEAMSATAEETARQSAAVATASESASASVGAVAAAADQLSSSIVEIGRQVEQASAVASGAVRQANETNAKMQGLTEAAEKIGAVLSLIGDIAAQTNLLALNATIEAARAGDAGKGFAVVASEVKNLANQTASATGEIATQIEGVQNSTRDAVEAIAAITRAVGDIDRISSAIAAAVEQQSAATQEIARSIEQASSGTSEVNTNIIGVNKAANDTGAVATQIRSAAGSLSEQADTLRTEVEKFLATVRA